MKEYNLYQCKNCKRTVLYEKLENLENLTHELYCPYIVTLNNTMCPAKKNGTMRFVKTVLTKERPHES